MPVYAKGKLRWQVVIHCRGTRQEFIVRGRKGEAEAFEARKRVELESADPAELRNVPRFSDFSVNLYRPHAETRLKPSTWYLRLFLIANLTEEFGDMKLNEIRPSHIDRYARARLADGLKAVSVNNELRVLRRMLNFAAERGMPVRKPTFKLLTERGASGAAKVKVWTDEEVGRLLQKCTARCSDECPEACEDHAPYPDLLPLLVFLANTGCRKGEALALRWENVDLKRRLIRIWPNEEWQPKNDKLREIPISEALLPWLPSDAGDRKSEWVFPAPRTGKPYVCWPKNQFNRVRKAAKLKGGPHTLRHTFASNFLANVPDLYLLAKILGHSDVTTTRIYAHLLPDHLARARDAVSFESAVGPAALAAMKKWSGKRS